MKKRKFFRAIARFLGFTGVCVGALGKGFLHLSKWTVWCGMKLVGLAVKILEHNQEPTK